MFYDSKVTRLCHLILFNVVYLNYSSIPHWSELGPAQPQLVSIFGYQLTNTMPYTQCLLMMFSKAHIPTYILTWVTGLIIPLVYGLGSTTYRAVAMKQLGLGEI